MNLWRKWGLLCAFIMRPALLQSSRYAGSSAMGATLSNYEGSLASRNPGFYGYNRNVRLHKSWSWAWEKVCTLHFLQEMKRSACVDLGETCAVRSGLMGTMIKIPCCEGYTCSLMGRTFKCMDETLLGELEDTIMDEIMEDQDQDIAKWKYFDFTATSSRFD